MKKTTFFLLKAAYLLSRLPKCDNNHAAIIKCCFVCLFRIKPFDAVQQVVTFINIYCIIGTENLNTHFSLMSLFEERGPAAMIRAQIILRCPQATVLLCLALNPQQKHSASVWTINNCTNSDLLIVFSNRKWQLDSMQCSCPWWIIGGFCSEWACVGVRQRGLAVWIYKRSNYLERNTGCCTRGYCRGGTASLLIVPWASCDHSPAALPYN